MSYLFVPVLLLSTLARVQVLVFLVPLHTLSFPEKSVVDKNRKLSMISDAE